MGNLADWANLGLFRLAIARRRVTTMKIYIDKTGSAETLLKIEAFLYCIFEFLNTGELDEYEMEMIQEDEFYNVSFLLSVSSFQDPLQKEKEDSKKQSTPVELKKEEPEDSEPEEKTEEKTEEKVDKEEEEDTVRDEKEESVEVSISKEGDKEEESVEASGAVEEDKEDESTKVEPSVDASAAEDKEESKNEITEEESKQNTETEASTAVEDDEPVKSSKSSKSSTKEDLKIEVPKNNPDSPTLLTPSKKKYGGYLSAKRSTSSKGHDSERNGRSPIISRKKKAERKGRSLSAFSRKRQILEPSMLPPLVRGSLLQLSTSGLRSSWKNRWAILNEEELELYKDEKCISLGKTVAIRAFASVSVSDTEFSELSESDDKSKKKRKEHVLYLELASETLTFALEDRTELLHWAIGFASIYKKVTGKSICSERDSLLKELYLENFGDQSAIKQGEEQWIFVAGKLTLVGKSIEYTWNGVSMKHSKGDNLGNITWDGVTFTFSRENKEDIVFSWVDCTGEFKSKPDADGNSVVVWNWTKDRFMQFLPVSGNGQYPVWKFLRPVSPPVAMCVELFSAELEGRDVLTAPAKPERKQISKSLVEIRKERKKNSSKKRKSSKRKSKKRGALKLKTSQGGTQKLRDESSETSKVEEKKDKSEKEE